ncbi:MAG TPA: response regulator transcription factor [Chloroflexota bacterium]
MKRITVLLVDDHRLLREGIRSLLEKSGDVEVVGEASEGGEAVAKAQSLSPDVVLMDITMPGMNGLEATRQIKALRPNIKVLILSMHESNQYISQFLRSGASGYVLKDSAASELVGAIQAVSQGDAFLYPSIARRLLEEYLQKAQAGEERESYDGLTGREREVLRMIAEGRSNKEIADVLSLSVRTVQAHRANLMGKLHMHDRTELVRYAIRKGLIPA